MQREKKISAAYKYDVEKHNKQWKKIKTEALTL